MKRGEMYHNHKGRKSPELNYYLTGEICYEGILYVKSEHWSTGTPQARKISFSERGRVPYGLGTQYRPQKFW